MDILFSLFNVNFIEYQMKCFSVFKEYLKHGDLSDVVHYFKQRTDSVIFLGLIERQVSGKKSILRSLTWTM